MIFKFKLPYFELCFIYLKLLNFFSEKRTKTYRNNDMMTLSHWNYPHSKAQPIIKIENTFIAFSWNFLIHGFPYETPSYIGFCSFTPIKLLFKHHSTADHKLGYFDLRVFYLPDFLILFLDLFIFTTCFTYSTKFLFCFFIDI